MIGYIRHKGLRNFYKSGTLRGIQAVHAARLDELLNAMLAARNIDELKQPGFRLHPMRGTIPVRWSLRVSANWRLTFQFEGGVAFEIDYEDYH